MVVPIKQLTGPSEAAGVMGRVAGQGYHKTGHFPRRAEFLVFHGDEGSPTEVENTMRADLKEEGEKIRDVTTDYFFLRRVTHEF